MKGLIWKDLINLKRQASVILVLLIFYVVLSVFSKNTSFFSGMIAVLCGMLPITALSYDERSRWDKYALAMPVSRTDLVISKYLLGLIFCLATFAINLIFGLLVGDAAPSETVVLSLFFAGIGLVFMSLLLPVLFRFGVEKGRFIAILILLLPTMLALLFSRGEIRISEEQLFSAAKYAALPVVVVLFALSLLLSLHIYRKKEF